MRGEMQKGGKIRHNNLREEDLFDAFEQCKKARGDAWKSTPVIVSLRCQTGEVAVAPTATAAAIKHNGLTIDVSIDDVESPSHLPVLTAGTLSGLALSGAVMRRHSVTIDIYMQRYHAPHRASDVHFITDGDKAFIRIDLIDNRRRDFFKEQQKDLPIPKHKLTR